MDAWNLSFESDCNRIIAQICAEGVPAKQRQAAWRQLMGKLAPHIEKWIATNRVLRRCRLSSEDDVRTVLVNVLARMNANGFENLHAYLARRPAHEEEKEEAALVEGLVRLSHSAEEQDGAPDEDLRVDTPLRGWLLSLTRFAVKDHIKQRLGWSTSVHLTMGLERTRGAAAPGVLLEAVRAIAGVVSAHLDEKTLTLEVVYLPGTARFEAIQAAMEAAKYRVVVAPDLRRSKRDLVTGAERFDTITDAGARPPMTDALTLRQLLSEVSAYMESFPELMRKAVRLWLEDEPFEAIATQLGLEDPERARALVRAGMARLRERFRAQWATVFER